MKGGYFEVVFDFEGLLAVLFGWDYELKELDHAFGESCNQFE
jgi:hypothetical protein